MNRRKFLFSAMLVASAVVVAPTALQVEQLLPTEVYNRTTNSWEPLVGGLRNIKRGQVFRFVYKGTHITHDAYSEFVEDGVNARYGMALEDGGSYIDPNGNLCGGVDSRFFENFPSVLA